MKIDLYTQNGEKKGEIDINKEIFEIPVNQKLIHEYLIYQQSNARHSLAHTKTKAEVRGGGRKPYRQKGTGNARQGSIRNPQFRGGGVAFGPRKERNFTKEMPKKQRRKALFCTLSAKAKDKQIIALESYENKDLKTKIFNEMLKKLPIKKDALFILSKKDAMIEKSSKNIPRVKTILVHYLNPHDILRFEKLVFLKDALPELEKTFLKKTISK